MKQQKEMVILKKSDIKFLAIAIFIGGLSLGWSITMLVLLYAVL